MFQITKEDYDLKTPFYEKIDLTLKITGTIDNVISYNESIIETTD